MHFKQPEILYFLFLLIVPILVHLFQLRRFKKEYFTNVRFLKALSVQTRKSSKIKKWLLLATRMLVLTGLILAFAQPFFEGVDRKNANNELYIILDNSFSMQAKGKKGELLKRAVQEILETAPENRSFSLITNSENYWNTDIKSIRNALQNLTYSATPFYLEQQLAKIKSHKSAYKKDIIIITDGIGIEKKISKDPESDENTFCIIPTAENKNNLSIDSVYIQQTLDDFYQINVAVTGYGEDFKPIPMALYNQGKLIAKTVVQLENSKKQILFTIPKKDFNGYVSIEDKGLEYDNILYFSISQNKKCTVLSIGETAKNAFLSRIYTPDEFNYTTSSLASLDYSTLEKQDAIVINELDEIPQALQTNLKSFVAKGKNLILIPSATGSLSNLNSLMNALGSFQFSPLEITEKQITKINFNHPLFQGVFDSKTNNFQYPKTKQSYLIPSTSAPILSYEDQSPFLTSPKNSNGSLFIFAAALNNINSNFQLSPLIVPVFYKMAVQNQNNVIKAFTIGDSQSYFVNTILSKDAILTVKNSKAEFIPTQQIVSEKVKLSFTNYPELAGNYGVFNAKKSIENISFNYSRTESDLGSANREAISDYKTIDSIESVFQTLETNRTDNQIWKWFLIFALLLLALEMAIIKFVK